METDKIEMIWSGEKEVLILPISYSLSMIEMNFFERLKFLFTGKSEKIGRFQNMRLKEGCIVIKAIDKKEEESK